MSAAPRRSVTVRLGIAQTLAWASSFYLPAILAAPMAGDLGVSVNSVYLSFSLALVVSALVGPAAGRFIDRHGGRTMLVTTSGGFALGLALLAMAQGPVSMLAGWTVVGIAMGCGLYEAAFASLVRWYGQGARAAITGVTLFAGFASTVGWPLSAWMEGHWGWRGACLGWAALHLCLGGPLNASLPRADAHGVDRPPGAPAAPGPTPTDTAPDLPRPRLTAALLAYVFAATWFTSTAMAAHLPRLLQAGGATLAGAVAAGALVGPFQVAGRLAEFTLLRRVHPLLSARWAAAGPPLGGALLLAWGAPLALPFALLHGAGNGILTIAKGTLPLVLFGPLGYGARQGWLMMPARVAQAAAPVLFGLALDRWGLQALWLTLALGLSALAALLLLRR